MCGNDGVYRAKVYVNAWGGDGNYTYDPGKEFPVSASACGSAKGTITVTSGDGQSVSKNYEFPTDCPANTPTPTELPNTPTATPGGPTSTPTNTPEATPGW